jgi:hypothetical protein
LRQSFSALAFVAPNTIAAPFDLQRQNSADLRVSVPETCGRFGEFIGAAYVYPDKKMSGVEFGLSKSEFEGQTFYFTGICDYAKFPEQ